MMVVPGRSPHQVTPAAAPGVHLADKPEFGQHLQGAVYGHQTYAGVLPAHLLMYRRRREVLTTVRDGIKDSGALRRNLETALPQYILYLLRRIYHLAS